MKKFVSRVKACILILFMFALVFSPAAASVSAQAPGPQMLVPKLKVRTAATGLTTPIGITFLAPNDFLVIEKMTGQVKRIVDGALHSTVLDLAVNAGSERGLLGITLHPNFPANPGVYLYWTESSTGADTTVLLETPLLGNRVDRYVWNGSTLTHDSNIIRLRALQTEGPAEGQPVRGNHDGGVIAFGPDGKLYIIVGDLGRRGWMQNLQCGPTLNCPGTTVPDDEFGGPQPDDAHLSGVILRLNDDGSTPADNPFYAAGAGIGGEVGENIQKLYAYGVRNSFGMAFDPYSGYLWEQENGDDSFDEVNRVEPGMNGGWIQFMGPSSRIDEFKLIETTMFNLTLQQLRWPPSNIADTPQEAMARLLMLPGAHYSEPEFSWKYAVAPAAVGFMKGRGLGPAFDGAMFMGAATPQLQGGYLFRFRLTADRKEIATKGRRLADKVADNTAKHDIRESESFLIGTNFGVVTDIETGLNGNLYAVSISTGNVYEIYAAAPPKKK